MSSNGIRRYCTHELQRMVGATEHLAELMGELRGAARSPLLRDALQWQLEGLTARRRALETCLTLLGHPFARQDNEEVAALCDSARKTLAQRDAVVRDVQIAHAAVRIEHYELGSYTALATMFRQLHLDEVADRLDGVVRELTAAERSLASVRDSITGLFEEDGERAIERGHRQPDAGFVVRP